VRLQRQAHPAHPGRPRCRDPATRVQQRLSVDQVRAPLNQGALRRGARTHRPISRRHHGRRACSSSAHSRSGRLWRGYLSCRLVARPMGPNVDMPDPQAEQRNPPHTSGNGVSAAERGSRAATGMVVVWWQSRHETSSSPGSARVGRAVIFQILHSLRHQGPLLRVAVIPGGRSGLARHRF
jgi:hypothetical protein